MSDENKPAGTTGFIAKVVALFAGAGAALAALPQDAILKEGIPGLWESLKSLVALNWLRLVEIYERLNPRVLAMARKLGNWAKLLLLLSAGLIAFGIQLKTSYGSDLGHVMVAAGVLIGAATLLAIWWFIDVFVAILAFKLDLAKKIVATAGATAANLASKVGVKFAGTPSDSHLSLDALKEKIKRAFAAIPVIAFLLMFVMLFPSWSTVGWVVCLSVPVLIIATAAVYLGKSFGKAIEVVLKVTVGILVFLFAMFLASRLFPRTFGGMSFEGLDGWFSARNRSEWIIMVLALILMGMLLKSAFVKDPVAKMSWKTATKYTFWGAVGLIVLLSLKGVMTSKEVTGKEAPKMPEIFSGSPKTETKAAVPQGTNSGGGTYMTPPSGGSDPMPREEGANPPSPRLRGARKQPLPPLKAKNYDDASSAVEDLKSLL